jgi:CHAT domain-containing protein/Tfp pilus assembly protein PilF
MRRVLGLAIALTASPAQAAVVVEEVREGFAARQAGLRPGDVLTDWERAPSPPANPDPAGGPIGSPFDLEWVEREQAPRGEVTLRGTRAGEPLAVRLPPGEWRLEPGAGPEGAGGPTAASWLHLRGARRAAEKKDAAEADQAWDAAVREARASGNPRAAAAVEGAHGRSLEDRSRWDEALAAYGRAIEAERSVAPRSMGEAWWRNLMGIVARKRGDLGGAQADLERALAIREELAPGSLPVASSLGSLGIVARARGDLEAAEDYQRRSLVIREKLAPGSVDVAAGLNNLGVVLTARSDYVGAEELYRRALTIRERLSPGTLELAAVLGNLGVLAEMRRDLARARAYYVRALEIKERWGEHLDTAVTLTNLANLSIREADLDAAEAQHGRVLAIKERLAPGSAVLALTLNNLGALSLRRGDTVRARGHLERALAIHEAHAPGSPEHSDTLAYMGEAALQAGDLAAAETFLQRSLEILGRRAPGSVREAEAFHRLATVHRRRNALDRAVDSQGRALAALEAQGQRLGGGGDARGRFFADHASYYRDMLDLLMEQGRAVDAFHVLERYRARGLLTLLAERDLVFAADVPPALDRERRMANLDYDRALAALAGANGADVEKRREALAAVRARQVEARDRIRAASPRLAALQYPEPLDLAGARAALDPGTLLLSYSIGDTKSYVFAVGPGPDQFAVVALDTTLGPLRSDVGQFRGLLQRGSALEALRLRDLSRRLGALLLGPVASRIAAAERVLVVPDGPLHLAPFAALAVPAAGGRHRYLVEAAPVHLAASATVFAEIGKRRRGARPATLVAFGDPDYAAGAPARTGPDVVPRLRSAQARGLDLAPLPATRREVATLEALYAGSSRAYLGAAATEERAKSVGDASLVHFACHGLADEASPLESSLALSLPRAWHPGAENGLLQAWEVFERVRMDVDLVTLSACGTALGAEMSGEGVLGLTRAFQYAGARTVLSSLWQVRDDSTADLMARFYGHLKRGRSKDEALRAAQIEMIRRSATAHPNRWAAFQLAGDWQ